MSASRSSPRADVDGDESMRTTSRMAVLAALGMTWDDGATTGEEGNTPPGGTPLGARGGVPPGDCNPKAWGNRGASLTTKVASLTDLRSTYALAEKKKKERSVRQRIKYQKQEGEQIDIPR
jgi:hypothetical protein